MPSLRRRAASLRIPSNSMADHDPEPALALARAQEAVRTAPHEPRAWLALAARHAGAQRFDAERDVLDQALERIPDHAELLVAGGFSAMRWKRLAAAEARFTRAAALAPDAPVPWRGLASLALAQGDPLRALARHREAVRRDVRHGPDLAGLAPALREGGHAETAGAVEDEARQHRPAAAAAWREAAIGLGNAGRYPQALAAAARAVQLVPDHAPAHALGGELLRLAGHPDRSLHAYATAVRLAPDSADYWNKLAMLQRSSRNLPAAEASLRRSLLADPAYVIARENLATLLFGDGRVAEGTGLLRDGVEVASAKDVSAGECAHWLAVLDEHVRLRPALDAALARESDVPIVAALVEQRRAEPADDRRLLDFLRELAARVPVDAVRAAGDGAGLATLPGWSAFEAHFALHLGDSIAALEATLRAFASHDDAAVSDPFRQKFPVLRRFARAVTLRREMPVAALSADDQEARLRFWHALLMQEQPELFPGQVKPFTVIVETNPGTPRTPPAQVAGTWRKLFCEVLPGVPPGPWRAALLYQGIVDCHGFRDGNGRVGRFLANLELERSGWSPIVYTDARTRSLSSALAAVRYLGDLEPLVELMQQAARDTRQLAARLAADAAEHG